MVESTDFAASLEATAKEIAAAAALYQRLPAQRDDLVAGLESLVDRLQLEWRAFTAKTCPQTGLRCLQGCTGDPCLGLKVPLAHWAWR